MAYILKQTAPKWAIFLELFAGFTAGIFINQIVQLRILEEERRKERVSVIG